MDKGEYWKKRTKVKTENKEKLTDKGENWKEKKENLTGQGEYWKKKKKKS